MEEPTIQSTVKQAEKDYKNSSYAKAAESYLRAQKLYANAGELLKAAEMANNASVALLKAGSPLAALEASQGTEQLFAQAGDQRSQAIALGNQAAALDALNRLEDALARYRLCSEFLKQIGDEENRAYVLKSISSLQIRTGHELEALASMDSALQNKKQLSFQERFLKKLLQIPFQMLKRGG
jgi:tetratricopeptide (TPR) repeat protein